MERREAPGVCETPRDEPLREVRPRALTRRVASPSREARASRPRWGCEARRADAAPPGAPRNRHPDVSGGPASLGPRHERGARKRYRIIFRVRESQVFGSGNFKFVITGLGPVIHVCLNLKKERGRPGQARP